MSCLAKHVGMAYVLRSADAAEVCVYADADVLFFGDASVAFDELEQKAVLLTPHQFGPGRDDALEHEYLLHGWINAGFLAFRKGHARTAAIVDWLIHRISRRGFLAVEFGLYVDQTWVSSLPFVFPDSVVISRNPGLNVAYWNLFERKLVETDGAILANEAPLLFFHFSGFDRTNPTRLSRHSDLAVPSGAVLEKVCRLYRSELSAASELEPKLARLKTLPCSGAGLRERITTGSMRNDLSIDSPTTAIGLFARIGKKVDSLLGKFTT